MAIATRQFDTRTASFDRSWLPLAFETGKLAVLADGSVKISLGENTLLVTAVMNKEPDRSKDFMPLMVDFRDSYSAAGKIGGGRFRKREGRPSDEAVLYSRLTDRALRPLFPKGMVNDVVITITPLAIDGTQDLGALCLLGSSVALQLAGIPFDGPVGACRVAFVDNQYVINPTLTQLETATMNLMVAGPQDLINMIEADGREAPAEIVERAWDIAMEHINQTIERQQEFIATVDTITDKSDKVVKNYPSDDLIAWVRTVLTDEKLSGIYRHSKEDFGELYAEYESEVMDAALDYIADETKLDFSHSSVKQAVFHVFKYFIRSRTIHEGVRVDGRDVMTIRPLYCEVDTIPLVHGSGLFWRGDTQVHSTVTLGSPGDVQLVDNMEEDDTEQRYMHHYNFPPYSVNDPRGTRGPGRREIGHGRLAEKALEYMIPDKQHFPYVIRVVSECMGSGGSTSMGSVCGSTLALMAAGVPLQEPVSGIAMGLMTELADDHRTIASYQVLNDIMGTEDFTGDMDFKIAGTRNGVTAIQLDTKLHGIPVSIVKETMTRGNDGRAEILNFMLQTIDKPRDHVNEHAPKIHVMTIKPEQIRDVIGKGGETIDKIIEKSGGVKIDIDQDGTVYLTGDSQAGVDKAIKLIEQITFEIEPGKNYDAEVTRVENYGTFISVAGKSGLVHVSNMGGGITDATTRFKVGETMKVQLLKTDEKGRMAFKRVVE